MSYFRQALFFVNILFCDAFLFQLSKRKIMKKENVLVSFSGGRTSAYMAKWLWDNCQECFNMVFVFANTGLEDYETLDFVAQCQRRFGFKIHLIEAKINLQKGVGTGYKEVDYYSQLTDPDKPQYDDDFKVIFESMTSFEQMVVKYGLPNPAFPHCTRELKTVPIRKFGQDYFGTNDFYQAIGIRVDEIDRMSVFAKEKKLIYPLVRLKVTQKIVDEFWSKQNFDLRLEHHEGNCVMCWKKDHRKLNILQKEKYHYAKHFWNLESKYKFHYPNKPILDEWGDEVPILMYRGHKSFDDISKMQVTKEEVLNIRKSKQESCEVHSECGYDN